MAFRKPNTVVSRCFFASGSTIHGIYSVFVPVTSKNTGTYIRSFLHVARCSFYILRGQTHSKNRCFCPTKTANTIRQRPLKSQKWSPRLPGKTHQKNTSPNRTSTTTNDETKGIVHFCPAGSWRVHAQTSSKSTVKHSVF